MDKGSVTLKVFFEEAYWIGVFERYSHYELSVCKIIFQKEPSDQEIYDMILRRYHQLNWSPSVEHVVKMKKRNPKRMQREIHAQVKDLKIGTKSQQAFVKQYEQKKSERMQLKKENKDKKKQYVFALKQQKRKEKHRGK